MTLKTYPSVALAAAALLCATAWAQPAPAAQSPSAHPASRPLAFSLNAGMRYGPAYLGAPADDMKLRAGLGFALAWSAWHIGLGADGLTAGWRPGSDLELGVLLRQRGRREARVLAGGSTLPELERSTEAGIYARYRWLPGLSTGFTLSQGVRPENTGWTSELSATQTLGLSPDWSLSAGAGLVVASGTYVERNFTLPGGADAARPKAGTGLAAVALSTAARYRWSPEIGLELGLRWTRFAGDAADSALVRINDSRQSVSYSAGISYRF